MHPVSVRVSGYVGEVRNLGGVMRHLFGFLRDELGDAFKSLRVGLPLFGVVHAPTSVILRE